MPAPTTVRRPMYRDDDFCFYAAPVIGRNYVELSPRSALYVPTNERFWNRDDQGKPRRGWDSPTAVYRLIGRSGLLYVGIGVQPEGRWQDHKHNKPWWNDVLVKTVDWLEDRQQAEIAEYYAIKHEAPRYNAQHLWPIGWHARRGRAVSEIRQRWGGRSTRESHNVPLAA
ncbi:MULTISPECIES: GIY-YIG nuclease family protein [unclassified Streptomyces]|uniref:GIY-YIG nuclease family protein n=1 Tax=unclassified Streptomyces TaxID=2593676 RepID=UPI00278C2E54|nr:MULTISPECIES: GIY-YIG nuclease family protein [unclassified Streptomyces]